MVPKISLVWLLLVKTTSSRLRGLNLQEIIIIASKLTNTGPRSAACLQPSLSSSVDRVTVCSSEGQRFNYRVSQISFNLFKWGIEPKGKQQEEEQQQHKQFLGLWLLAAGNNGIIIMSHSTEIHVHQNLFMRTFPKLIPVHIPENLLAIVFSIRRWDNLLLRKTRPHVSILKCFVGLGQVLSYHHQHIWGMWTFFWWKWISVKWVYDH